MPRKTYTPEFKAEVVSAYYEAKQTREAFAKSQGLSTRTLRSWLQSDMEKRSSLEKTLLEKVNQLEAENKKLLMHQDILKKAAAFFASDQ